MPASKFESIKFLPDPIPDMDGHYKTFSEIYGSTTTEEHRPSLIDSQKKESTLQNNRFLYYAATCDKCWGCDTTRGV